MPERLFSLRYVPDDEAQELRELLDKYHIEYYETGAFWLRNDEQLEEAKRLIETCQEQRAAKARQEYEDLKLEGRQRTFLDVVREKPLQLILYVAAILFILYFSLKPFLVIGR